MRKVNINNHRNSKVLIVDDFYDSPEEVRKLALKSSYANIEKTDYPGFASKLTISNSALKARFEQLIKQKVVVDPSRFTWGGFRFITKDTGGRPNIHADTATDWAAMVYLTPDAPNSAGTGFYKHKATDFNGPPSDREARSMGFADSSEYDDRIICPDKVDLEKWELIEKVDPVFNRLIIFKGADLYHAPLGGCGMSKETARLTHIFFFNTVPNVGSAYDSRSNANTTNILHTSSSKQGDNNSIKISSLVEAIKQVVAPCNSGTFKLAPYQNDELANLSYNELAHKCALETRLFESAVDICKAKYSLRDLILIEMDNSSEIKIFWPINGWNILRKICHPVDLQHAELERARLDGANFHGSNLENANLRGASMVKSDLSETNLRGADFTGANLYSSSLSKSDLSFTDLSRCDLRHSDLRETICINTAFRGADLWNCYAWGINLSDAFTEGVDFDRADNTPDVIQSKNTAANR